MPNTNPTLRRTATEVKNHRRVVRITWAVIGVLLALTVLLSVISVLYSRYGSFTVTINKLDNIKYGLALAESREFGAPTARINYKSNEEVTNISKDALPINLDSDEGGEHSGANYSAYTFFLKNTGKTAVTIQYELFIANMSNGMQDAIRVRFYVDGEYEDFAEAAKGGGPEPDTTIFLTETTVLKRTIDNYLPDQITRFTVVLWIEGDDPDCTDDILGGQVKFDMNIIVLSSEDEDNSASDGLAG